MKILDGSPCSRCVFWNVVNFWTFCQIRGLSVRLVDLTQKKRLTKGAGLITSAYFIQHSNNLMHREFCLGKKANKKNCKENKGCREGPERKKIKWRENRTYSGIFNRMSKKCEKKTLDSLNDDQFRPRGLADQTISLVTLCDIFRTISTAGNFKAKKHCWLEVHEISFSEADFYKTFFYSHPNGAEIRSMVSKCRWDNQHG